MGGCGAGPGETLRRILDSVDEAFIATDEALTIVAWNRRAADMFGWTRAEVIGHPLASVIVPEELRDDHDTAMHRFVADRAGRTPEGTVDTVGLHRSGHRMPVRVTHGVVEEPDCRIVYAFVRDMSELHEQQVELVRRREREAELAHRALHDDLTGLANRRLAMDRLTNALEREERYGRELAVLFVDLDRFKAVNDSLGHDAGDAALRLVAQRLLQAVRTVDTVARISGDEFIVICEELHGADEATAVAERILTSLNDPMEIDGAAFRLGASIGVALRPWEGAGTGGSTGAEDLVRHADAAMYQAKQQGRGRIVVFDDRMRDLRHGQLQLEQEILGSPERGELALRYVPITHAGSSRLAGVALRVCWLHPRLGLLTPDRFLHIAADGDLVDEIVAWTMLQGMRELADWRRRGFAPAFVHVNVPAAQLTQPLFPQSLADGLRRSDTDPRVVQIGLDAPSLQLAHGIDAVRPQLRQLRDIGVRLSLTRVGAGCALLPLLRTFPFDMIAVAPLLTAGVGDDPRGYEIIRWFAELAARLDSTVLAADVESTLDAQALARAGCAYISPSREKVLLDAGEVLALADSAT